MRTVGISVLKNKLNEYVRLAESGETVLVTDRDRVVAELRPPEPGRAVVPADALLADAVRRGLITAPRAPGSGPPPSRPVTSLRALLNDLANGHEDRRL